MANSDITKIVPRVTWIIGARGSAFDTTVSDDRFILEEIERAIIETESEIVRTLAEAYHPMRSTFLNWSVDLTNESAVPAHVGQIEAVKIKPYSASATYNMAESTSRDNIRAWRANVNNVFDAAAHDQNGSALAGYYNITNNIISFTGSVAQVNICSYTPNYATPALQVDGQFDDLLVAGTIPKLNKLGVPQALIATYGVAYSEGLSALRGGLQSAPEIAVAQAVE